MRVRLHWLALVALSGSLPLGAQTTGTIRGQVVDSVSQRPLIGAEVTLTPAGGAGATIAGRVGDGGQYTLNNVPVGTGLLRVRLVGYAPVQRTVTVRGGEATTVDVAMTQRLLQLDQVVVTGTAGVTQRRAVGNVIESISASEVLQLAPARSVEQLMGSRTSGLVVLPASGQVGTGAQLRIRGATSLSLSNEPLIYIDGVRIDGNVSRGPVQRGGGGASRLNDINPQDIESIEVIKGPAASTLYGTEASNGVVQIITKRGKSGKTTFDFTTRQGTNWMMDPEGRAGFLFAPNATTGALDSINLYEYEKDNGKGPIFTNGMNQGYIGSLNGGTEANRYYLSAAWDDDVGIVKYNWDKKFTARANVDVLATKSLRIQGSIGHIRDRIRLAQQAIDIDPFSNLVWGTPRALSTVRRGFGFSPPETWETAESRADNDRTTTSITLNFNPREWFTHRLVTGLDVSAENNSNLYPRQPLGALDPLGQNGLGSKTVSRANRTFLTLDYAGSVKYGLGSDLRFTSAVGLQHYRNELSNITASGLTFPAGPITTVSGGATRNGDETYIANATVGVFGQQEVAWKNRLFVTAAIRGDDNSAFGRDFKAAYYPKLSGSWVMSEEPWFKVPGVQTFRVRGAFGAAGTQPGTFDAARLYDPSVGYQNQPGLVPGSFGNPQLKPERSTELEMGFEASMLNGRVDASFTNYGRNITDAIVNSPIAPSVGFPGSQVINIGKVKGWGRELTLNVRVIEGRKVGWELGTQLASNRNRIEDMGSTQFLTVGGGGQAQNRVGWSIADFFMYKVRTATLSPTGAVLTSTCDGGRGLQGLEQGGPDTPCANAPRVFWGHSQPTWQVGLNSTLTLFGNLRLYARVDGNGGHIQSNTEIRALHNQGSSKAVILRNDPLLQTYRAIEADAPGTYKAGFLRLRELSAAYNFNPNWIKRLGASGASFNVAGRNLSMLYTEQHGWGTPRNGRINVDVAERHTWDPEIRSVGQLSNGFQTILPPTASFVTTFRISY